MEFSFIVKDRVLKATILKNHSEVVEGEFRSSKFSDIEGYLKQCSSSIDYVVFLEVRGIATFGMMKKAIEGCCKRNGLEFKFQELPPEDPHPKNWLTEEELIGQVISKIKKHMTLEVVVIKERGYKDIIIESGIGRTLGYFQGDLFKAERIGKRIKKSVKNVRVEVKEIPHLYAFR